MYNFLVKKTCAFIIILMLLSSCGPALSIKEYNSSWIGVSSDRVKEHFKGERLYSNRVGLKEDGNKFLRQNLGKSFIDGLTIFRAFEYHNHKGTCYTDFIINPESGKVIGYLFRGNVELCNTY